MSIKRTIKPNLEQEAPTIHALFKKFMQEKQAKNLAKISLRDYMQSYVFFMRDNKFGEKTLIERITQDVINQWSLDMVSKGLKPSSINRYLRDIRTFVNWCVANEKLTEAIKFQMVKGQDEGIKSFPEQDILLITKKPNNQNNFTEWRTWTVIQWILATGNRCSTVCNVKLGDIDFRNKEISLRHTKNKKAQVIPLSSTLEHVIKDYIRVWRHDASENDWLFPNTENGFLSPTALAQAFSKYCKARGSSHTNIHGLRHTFALNYIRLGGNEFKLQKILGHKTLEMTRRYVDLVSVDLKEDFDKFSTLDALRKSCKPRKTIMREVV